MVANKNTILAGFFLFFLNSPVFGQINNPFFRFWSGLFAPVYLTGTELEVTKVNPDPKREKKIKIPQGTYYSILDNDDSTYYLKITSRLKIENSNGDSIDVLLSRIDYRRKILEPRSNYKEYRKKFIKCDDLFKIENPNRYNKIFKQGVTVGTLFLPIKLRPSLYILSDEDNVLVKYDREFSTDISVGPFMGYKYHVGEYYNQFIKFGVFAGPSLIKLTSKNLLNGQEGDINVLGFSWGGGLAGEFKKFQVGFIIGWDYLSGESAKNWVYDKKVWYSIGIGFNFFQDNDNSTK